MTTYHYDTLDRLSQITYNDSTPAVTYTYGADADKNIFAAGRLTGITDGSGTQAFEYDNLGRSKQVTRTIGGNPYITQYAYSAGQLNVITYPSGRTVTMTPDPVGRLQTLDSNGSNLLTVGAYNAAGEVTNLQYGDGMEETYGYNDQLQLQTLVAGSTTTPSMNLTYNYGSLDNGQIQGITDNITASQSTSYEYDELGRLKTAQTTDQTSAGTWKLGFKYDNYGNRLAQLPEGGTASMPINEVGVDPTTNRISADQYDAAGNMTNDGLHTYTYDAENRLTKVDGGAETFVYDAAGMRVKKNSTVYIYGGGHAIAEYANGAPATSPSLEYVGGLAAFSGGTTTYFYQDHLSNRFLANASGTVTGTLSQFPFGELTSGGTNTKWAFTNYERDNAGGDSGLDYAYGRFYSSRLGRFMSLDPLAGNLANAQSLNRYAYVQNDPINAIDPTGMLTGKLTCYLLDSGDCQGGNGYVPGGSGGGDPFGVNDDPWGPMVDPTSRDPLAEGQAAYEQHMYDDLYNAGKGDRNPGDPAPVDISITVYCNSDGGVGWDCSLAGDSQKFVFDPYDHAHIGDRPAGELAQRMFQGNRGLWQQSAITGNVLGGAAMAFVGGAGYVVAAPTVINILGETYYLLPATPPLVNWITSATKSVGTTSGAIFQIMWGAKYVACNTVVTCDNFLRPN